MQQSVNETTTQLAERENAENEDTTDEPLTTDEGKAITLIASKLTLLKLSLLQFYGMNGKQLPIQKCYFYIPITSDTSSWS